MGQAIDSRGSAPAPSACAARAGRSAYASAVWSVVRFGCCVLLLSLLFSVLALPWFRLSWWQIFRRCVSISAALTLGLSARMFEKRSVRSYGFGSFREGARQLFFGFLLGATALAFLFGVGLITGAQRVAITPDHLKLWRTVLGFIPVAFLVAILEELVFRGFILQQLLTCSRWFACFASSALYAVVHLKSQALTPSVWLELGGLFLLGQVLALSYLATNQLYLAVGLHAVLAYGARVNKLVIELSDQSLSWLMGTSRLVNGLMSWVMLLVVGGIVWWWAQSFKREQRSTSTMITGR